MTKASPDFHRKIVDKAGLLEAVADARRQGRTTVQCHGCFDIVHPGHIRYLQFARSQGDVLLVSLTGDLDITKGDQRPYIPQELRAENLAALEFVDLVYVDPNQTAEQVLGEVQPDVYVKGAEYENSPHPGFLREQQIVEEHGGKVIFSSGDVVFSSTQILETMGREADLESHRLNLICRRHNLSQQTMKSSLDRFSGLRVLVVGDIVLDRYVFCDAIDIASESPMMSLCELEQKTYVGGAAIVARHAAALGASVCLVSSISKDESRDQVELVLADECIDSVLVPARRKLATKTRYLVEEQKLLRVESAENEPLDSLSEQQVAKVLEQHAAQVDAVIFCDFGYGTLTGGLLGRALPVLRKKVKILAADVSGRRGNLTHFKDVDLLTPTERELRATLHDFEQGLTLVAWQALQRTNARHLFVTLGKRGLVVFDRRSQDPASADYSGRLVSEHLPSFADRALDWLGCGDAMLAASTLALASDVPLIEAAYLGNAAAAMEAARFGNIPIDDRMMREWMGRRPELVRESVPQLVSEQED